MASFLPILPPPITTTTIIITSPHLLEKNMDTTSLRCELKIVRAKNIELKKSAESHLFVRCYLPTGNHDNRSVQVNSKEIISTDNNSDLFWDDSFSLQCSGTEEAIQSLRKGNVVFELRCRKKSILGRRSSSKLLGRAEIPWKSVFDSPNMENETWVPMISKKNLRRRSVVINDEDLIKPPAVQVSMKIIHNRVPADERKPIRAKNIDRLKGWNEECGCMDCKINGCHSFADLDAFAIGFALEAC